MLDAVEPSRPIVTVGDLTPTVFETTMRRHGCVLVRGLFGVSDVAALRNASAETYRFYDNAMANLARGGPHSDNVFYVNAEGIRDTQSYLANFRRFGSLVLGYCPHASGVISTTLSRSPIKGCVEHYLGGPIGLSLNASSVRLSEINNDVRRVFHQDGNFLGGFDAETVNCWIALDDCGEDAPGLEVFPERVDELLPAGEQGALVAWEIAEPVVYGRLGANKAWFPSFRAGDAFIFDHLHVHRTYLTERMTRDRFAIESWMFPIKERYRSKLLAWLG